MANQVPAAHQAAQQISHPETRACSGFLFFTSLSPIFLLFRKIFLWF